jgi:Methylamine utilization protein MauJ
MWFPYTLPVRWKAESDRGRIAASLADETEREFLIGFYLHSRVTHEWEVELQLKEPHWESGTEQGQAFSVGYYPNETGQLAEIICRIRESDPTKALRRCHAYVSRIFNCWSALKGRGFAVLGFRVADVDHDARWRVLPHRPSAESFELPPCEVLPEPYWTALALYREARNSPNDTYRFLCCHKILQLWVRRTEPFSLLREHAAGSGRELENPDVTRDMLVLSGLMDFRPELEGIGFDKLLESLAPWRDWAVQALIDERPPPALDDYDLGLELGSVANLIDLAAHRVLADEIKCWQSIMNAPRP